MKIVDGSAQRRRLAAYAFLLCTTVPVLVGMVIMAIGAVEAQQAALSDRFLPRVDPWGLVFYGAVSVGALYVVLRSTSAILGGTAQQAAYLLVLTLVVLFVLLLSFLAVANNSVCLTQTPCIVLLGTP